MECRQLAAQADAAKADGVDYALTMDADVMLTDDFLATFGKYVAAGVDVISFMEWCSQVRLVRFRLRHWRAGMLLPYVLFVAPLRRWSLPRQQRTRCKLTGPSVQHRCQCHPCLQIVWWKTTVLDNFCNTLVDMLTMPTQVDDGSLSAVA